MVQEKCKYLTNNMKCLLHKPRFFGLFGKPECIKDCKDIITVSVIAQKINNEYFFKPLEENLVNEIYSYFLKYDYILKIQKVKDREYLMEVNNNLYTISEKGLICKSE